MSCKDIKIALIGGDARQLYIAKELAEICECAVFALPGDTGNAVKSTCAESALKKADAIILPMPASRDGVYVSCPLAPDLAPLLTDIAEFGRGAYLAGGMLSPTFCELCRARDIRVYDYYKSDALQIKNALPTAEGALEILIREMPETVYNSHLLIFGFGRVARAAAKAFTALGANVTVAARSRTDLALASCCGCAVADLHSPKLTEIIGGTKWNAVINTVPAPVITPELLSNMPKGIPLVELASGAGGTTAEAAEKAGIRLIPAPALPGKTAPVTAAKIITECITDYLKEVDLL